MALIKCKECNKEISTSAVACPHCGATPPKESSKLAIAFIFVIVAIIGAALSTNYQEHNKKIVATKIKYTPTPASSTLMPSQKWHFYIDENPVDDSTTSTLFLSPDSGKSKWGKSFTMVMRCKSNTTELYVKWHDYLGDDSNDVYQDWKWITVRIGENKAKKEKWDISTDNTATFSRTAIATLREIAKADKLLFSTIPYNENASTAIYDTKGLSEGIKKIADACHWKL
jgi:hypothetical protein